MALLRAFLLGCFLQLFFILFYCLVKKYIFSFGDQNRAKVDESVAPMKACCIVKE
jgi:hypothetical protein